MTRILDLQKLNTSFDAEVNAAAGSTSSWVGCSCSTSSNTGCGTKDDIILV